MSDLTATNCGCNDSCGCTQNNSWFGGNSCIWILLLLFCCGGNGGLFGGNNCGCGNGCNNGCGGSLFGNGGGCCEWIIWILLLSCFCGGNSCGCNNSCGC